MSKISEPPRSPRLFPLSGLSGVSTYTIGRILHAAGYSWQRGRSWCETGVVVRKRKHAGPVTVTDPDAAAKRG